MMTPLINANTRAVSPSGSILQFGGFLSIHCYQPGGLDSRLSAYLIGKRDDYFIVDLAKVLPNLRKGAAFSYSVGMSLGSISLAGSPKNESGKLLSEVLFDFAYYTNLLYGAPTPKKGFRGSMLVSRFWKSPFRPGYYGRWIPGAFTNYPNVIKSYSKKSAPKVVVYRYRLARDLQSWFLPKWFPSFMGVFDMVTSAPAVREASRMCVPTVSIGGMPTRSIMVSEATYPVVGNPTDFSASVIYKVVSDNYYRGFSYKMYDLRNSIRERILSPKESVSPSSSRSPAEPSPHPGISKEQFLEAFKGKPTKAEYIAELIRLRLEKEEQRKEEELKKKLEEQDRKRYEDNPGYKPSKFVANAHDKLVLFQPYFESKGRPYGARLAESVRREKTYHVRKNDPAIPSNMWGNIFSYRYGLYLDHFDKDGYLRPGYTLWNETVTAGQEDPISQKYLRDYKGKNPRPDLKNPNINHGLNPPSLPGEGKDRKDNKEKYAKPFAKGQSNSKPGNSIGKKAADRARFKPQKGKKK